ncbi:MAG: radical SAM protein [Oscillospiraceae bacterium]|nr:radical SAM protein [Oscillospiraceae bacterium]
MTTFYLFGRGFNYSEDGPGNRLVLHLSGCSLRCPWCSNPEGKSRSAGEKITEEDLLREILSAKPMMFSGGGVTFTGGEATEQFGALSSILPKLHEHGVSVCLETNGTHPRLPELFPLIDYLIMDCKHYDPEKHHAVIGVAPGTIYANLTAAGRQRSQLAVRIPLIGGFNETPDDAAKFAELFDRLGIRGSMTLELLRYHTYGVEKYKKLGIPYTMTERANVSEEQRRAAEAVFTERGFRVIRS